MTINYFVKKAFTLAGSSVGDSNISTSRLFCIKGKARICWGQVGYGKRERGDWGEIQGDNKKQAALQMFN